MVDILMPFFVALTITLIMTPIVRKLAFKIGAVDIPKDNRRMHKKPMPLIGGLAIYIGVILSILFFLPMDKSIVGIIIGGSIILISGMIDDLSELSPRMKIIFQLFAALVLLYSGVKIDFITNPFGGANSLLYLGWVSIPVSIFWITGITNTVNLIDGLDGLATGVSMVSSLSLLYVANKFGDTNISILAAIMAGSCLGFLPYNFNPAKIFMGDTGALFLGFMLAAISIEGVMKSVATIAVVVPVIILGVPIFDTTFAIIRRYLNGKSITSADKGHLHHRLLMEGYSQKKTVLILYLISAVFGFFAAIIASANGREALYLSVFLLFATILIARKAGLFKAKKQEEDL